MILPTVSPSPANETAFQIDTVIDALEKKSVHPHGSKDTRSAAAPAVKRNDAAGILSQV